MVKYPTIPFSLKYLPTDVVKFQKYIHIQPSGIFCFFGRVTIGLNKPSFDPALKSLLELLSYLIQV